MGDDPRHGSGLGQQRVQVADRPLLVACLAGDHDRVQPGAQLTQPRDVAGADGRAILDPVPPRERDDPVDVGKLVRSVRPTGEGPSELPASAATRPPGGGRC